MKAGRFAEACPKLLQSQRLDPGMGTKYRLAECYESTGLVGSAWALFTQVGAEARAAGRADRATQAQQHADALLPRLPRMTVMVPAAVAGLPGIEVTRDGERIDPSTWGRSLPVDPGAHTLAARAPGKRAWEQTVRSLEGGSLDVIVPPLDDGAGPAGGSGLFVAGVVTGAVGLVGLAVGGALGGLAKSRWNDALSGCQGGDTTKCSPAAIADGHKASTLAAGSTAGFVAGGVALAGGVIMLVVGAPRKPPASGWRVLPAVGPGGVAGVVRGSF